MPKQNFLTLISLSPEWVDAAVSLDIKVFGGKWSRGNYETEILRPGTLGLGLVQNTKLIGMGFIWIIVDEAHLVMLAVDPEHQSKGFGSLLLSHLMRQAIGHKCERATLEVSAQNVSALNLYQKFSFRELGRRSSYYEDGQDAIIMWLNHLQSDSYQSFLQDLAKNLTLVDSSI